MVNKAKVSFRSNVDKKLRKAETIYGKASDRTSKQVAELGKMFARKIAPFDSGNLVRLIKIMKSRGKFEYSVMSQNPKSKRKFGKGNYPNFDLVQWMHKTGGVFKSDNPYGKAGTKHIKSGDPRYMYTTLRYLKSIAGVTARKNFKQIKIR